ncbi:Hypothetical protein CAP_7028 [Chondromyces apiculatus DSM 436]|uniref:Uncharacterized protein n=1 Tax=Chondromyces apiculatus DSM 436 TaxID=1192034 RepID=A0A017THD3_9BACT|nr:Hypothetical protein CAP_7028 [Chondromyces apiculatus DSM 436]
MARRGDVHIMDFPYVHREIPNPSMRIGAVESPPPEVAWSGTVG